MVDHAAPVPAHCTIADPGGVRARTTMLGALALALAAVSASGSTLLSRAAAAEHQVDATALAAAVEAAHQLGYVDGMVVVRDGAVIAEGHWSGAPGALHESRAVTESVTSLLVGIAIERGFIKEGLAARLVDYLPAALLPGDPAKADIRLFHLLLMISGLRWDGAADEYPWLASPDPVGYVLGRPLAASPGTAWNDDPAAAHLLSVVITRATGMSTLEFADTYLFGPLGITDRSWEAIGGYCNGARGLWLSTEDLAKLGVLLVHHGAYNGRQVVSRWWTNLATYPHVRNIGPLAPLEQRNFGALWWVPVGVGYAASVAWGYGGQFVFCVPGLELVVATTARCPVLQSAATRQEVAILRVIVEQIIPAATDRRVFTVTGQDVPELAAIDDMVRATMQAGDISRATAALTKDGRLVLAHGYTWDEPGVTPTEPTATFRIGSVSKAITSVAIHQLVERGLLAYDTPVAATLGLEPPPGGTADPRLAEVTVDNLLTHTVGWDKEDGGIDPLLFKDWLIAETVGTTPPVTREEIATFMAGQPMQFDPGTRWAYCNFGYLLLELLAEHVTGVSFPEWVQENVFRPIGVGRVRPGHSREDELFPGESAYDGVLEGNPYSFGAENAFAAGTQVMATPDLARLLSQLFDTPDARGLLKQETIDDMLAYPFPVGEEVGYGRGWFHTKIFALLGHTMGWFTDPTTGAEVYGHTGQGPGQQAFGLWNSRGIVLAFMDNKDSVIQDLDDLPVIQSWPQTDLWESVGITDTPAAEAPTEAWIPVVAHNQGVGGSVWRSDVGLLNRSPLANRVRLRAYAADGEHDHELELGVGEALSVDDVLAVLGTTGTAPLRVFSSEPLTVTSRTYDEDAAGTFGQSIESVCGTCGLGTGDAVVLTQLREDARHRSNIGITNTWKRPAYIRVELYDGDGSEVTSFLRTVAPESTLQLNRPFRGEGGRSDISSGYAVLTVELGRNVLVYGSVVDNGTNDPTPIPALRAGGAMHQWIAGAAHTAGFHQSVWRTDLALLNLSGQRAQVRVIFHGSTGVAETSLALAEGEQTIVADIVAALGASGSGALEVVSDVPLLASARTYNESSDGTFGQYYGGLAVTAGAAAGETRWLTALRQDGRFRTNITLVNAGDEAALVRVRLFQSDGEELVSTTRTVGASTSVQLLEPFVRLAGRGDITSGYARVEVDSGSSILTLASVMDNATNDPTTVEPLR